jgi:SET domain-containing protein 6
MKNYFRLFRYGHVGYFTTLSFISHIILQTRTDLFPAHLNEQHYSIEQYHIMGSRILSRSFTVEKWREGEGEVEEVEDEDENAEKTSFSATAEMDVDDDEPGSSNIGDIEDSDDDSSDIALVPMADMLNACYGSENVRPVFFTPLRIS